MPKLAYTMRDFIILEGKKEKKTEVSEWKNIIGRNREVKRWEAILIQNNNGRTGSGTGKEKK